MALNALLKAEYETEMFQKCHFFILFSFFIHVSITFGFSVKWSLAELYNLSTNCRLIAPLGFKPRTSGGCK